MKKALSYLLPLLALLIIVILIFRWYNSMRSDTGEISSNAEGIEISDLTDDEPSLFGVEDARSVEIQDAETGYNAEVRLGEPAEDQDSVPFTIFASLPELEEDGSFYQVWFEGEKGRKKAMRLDYRKGGYMADGRVSSEFDQLKLYISKEMVDDDQIEDVLIQGNVEITPESTIEMEQ